MNIPKLNSFLKWNKEKGSWFTDSGAKENLKLSHDCLIQRQASDTNPPMVVLGQGHYWVWGLTNRGATKDENVAIKRDWIYNQIYRLSHILQK